MNKIKVAVIGTGSMGKFHTKTYKENNNCELVGIYDLNQDAAKEVAKNFGCVAFSSLEEAANSVDAVSIATPSSTHGNVGEFFLNKGIHCLIEKPLATTESECVKLINAAEKSGATLLVGHIERFNPAVTQMSKLLADNKKIRSLEARRMSHVSGRIIDVDIAMDLMIHDIEVIQSLVKSPVSKVTATSVKTPDQPKGKDFITAGIEFENGVTASMTASRVTQARVRSLNVTTDTNYIEMDFMAQSINVHTQGRNPLINKDDTPDWMNYGLKGSMEQLYIPASQPLTSEINHFIDCINGNTKPMISGTDALNALRVIWEVQNQLGFFNEAVAQAAE